MDGQPRPGPLTWGITAAMIVLALSVRLIPFEYRMFNLTAFGALALFAGARLRLGQSLLVLITTMLLSDFWLFVNHGYDRQYLPNAAVYVAFPMYLLFAWVFLRSTENALAIGGAAAVGGVLFFVISNFAAWLSMSHFYERTPEGLIDCYETALPFYKGTLFGDLLFTGLAFGAHAVMSRAWFPKERVVPITVDD